MLAGVAFMIARTRLGLFVRGVTQNRAMASCVGVNTARTDTYAFALGSGIAGLAGCALSQIGNVGPDLGQNYIVDSFLVVVLGGVSGRLRPVPLAQLDLKQSGQGPGCHQPGSPTSHSSGSIPSRAPSSCPQMASPPPLPSGRDRSSR